MTSLSDRPIAKIALIVTALVLAVGAGAILIGPPPETGATTSTEALAQSEATTQMVDDPLHDRPFEVSVWEPTADVAQDELIIISHGFSGDRTSHANLAQGLVAQGYTVAAPTHPDLAGLESGDPRLDPFVLRPRHLSLTIDAMAARAGDPFGSVTVVGYSLGGYSALRLVGAVPEFGADAATHCSTTDDALLCSGRVEIRAGAEAVRADFSDERVDRIVLLAPGYGPLFSTATLNIDASVMVVGAESDTELRGDQVAHLANRFPDNAESSTVPGGHFVFMRPCTAAEASAVPAICTDPEGVDRATIIQELAHTIGEFADVG